MVPKFPDLLLGLGKEDRVHIWHATLKPGVSIADLRRVLSRDEILRAEGYRFERDRIQFTFGRAVARIILARYLSADPATIHISYGRHGKPELRDKSAAGTPLFFNISRKRDHIVVAVARNRSVGVDIEYIDDQVSVSAIANTYFQLEESAYLQKLPTAERLREFYRIWTRKEAILKALGTGLEYPLDSFSALQDTVVMEATWRIVNFETAPGYIGAVAINDDPPTVDFYCADPLVTEFQTSQIPVGVLDRCVTPEHRQTYT
ncbi:MAG TPA: 4'-phosphopantetheinyl transferase superfamily protein [Methanocella sp.]|nr:4'-phosphopantetheinyl transferase superfamily protein [Methanocella sp.]